MLSLIGLLVFGFIVGMGVYITIKRLMQLHEVEHKYEMLEEYRNKMKETKHE